MATLVLEQTFETPVSEEFLNDTGRRVDRCLEAHGARWMRSYLSKDRKRLICEFEAPDAEQVRDSFRSAGLPFDNCWAATLYSLEDPRQKY
jgi:hypothetical protein